MNDTFARRFSGVGYRPEKLLSRLRCEKKETGFPAMLTYTDFRNKKSGWESAPETPHGPLCLAHILLERSQLPPSTRR